MGAFWAEFYGTAHIGSIKAIAGAIMVFGSAIGPGITGAIIDLGIDFPGQMIWIAIYFACAAICATLAAGIARRQLALCDKTRLKLLRWKNRRTDESSIGVQRTWSPGARG